MPDHHTPTNQVPPEAMKQGSNGEIGYLCGLRERTPIAYIFINRVAKRRLLNDLASAIRRQRSTDDEGAHIVRTWRVFAQREV